MSNFRPGDEVEAIHLRCLGTAYDASVSLLRLKIRYTEVGYTPNGVVILAEARSLHPCGGWNPTRFRKVQRRNSRLTIESFSVIKDGWEEPKRAPAKERAKEESK